MGTLQLESWDMNPEHVRWSRNHFNLLSLNATWAVPRSGLIFKKVSQLQLALDNVMPWSDEIGQGWRRGMDVPRNAKELLRYQRSDFEVIAKNFGAAGVDVTDPKQLLKD
jgi:hypothetical protein